MGSCNSVGRRWDKRKSTKRGKTMEDFREWWFQKLEVEEQGKSCRSGSNHRSCTAFCWSGGLRTPNPPLFRGKHIVSKLMRGVCFAETKPKICDCSWRKSLFGIERIRRTCHNLERMREFRIVTRPRNEKGRCECNWKLISSRDKSEIK